VLREQAAAKAVATVVELKAKHDDFCSATLQARPIHSSQRVNGSNVKECVQVCRCAYQRLPT
jgi:hypothetical protein